MFRFLSFKPNDPSCPTLGEKLRKALHGALTQLGQDLEISPIKSASIIEGIERNQDPEDIDHVLRKLEIVEVRSSHTASVGNSVAWKIECAWSIQKTTALECTWEVFVLKNPKCYRLIMVDKGSIPYYGAPVPHKTQIRLASRGPYCSIEVGSREGSGPTLPITIRSQTSYFSNIDAKPPTWSADNLETYEMEPSIKVPLITFIDSFAEVKRPNVNGDLVEESIRMGFMALGNRISIEGLDLLTVFSSLQNSVPLAFRLSQIMGGEIVQGTREYIPTKFRASWSVKVLWSVAKVTKFNFETHLVMYYSKANDPTFELGEKFVDCNLSWKGQDPTHWKEGGPPMRPHPCHKGQSFEDDKGFIASSHKFYVNIA